MSKSAIEFILCEQLLPIERQQKFAKNYVFSPIHISIFACFALSQSLGIYRQEMGELSPFANFLFFSLKTAVYLILLYGIFPHSLRFCAVKRIPFFIHNFVNWLAFLSLYTIVFGDLISQYSTIPILTRFLSQFLFAMPFIILLSSAFGERASIALFGKADYYPAFKRYVVPTQPIFRKMRPENISPIRYIEANSPYVCIVTNTGSETIRMTFKQALESVQLDMGWQIHRSIWVSKSEVQSVRFVNGNPKVYLHDGTELPAKRAVVSEIKSYLYQRDYENVIPFDAS